MDPTAVYPPVAVTPLFWSHVGRLSSPSSSTSPLVTVTSATSTNNSSASAPTAADIAAAKFLKVRLCHVGCMICLYSYFTLPPVFFLVAG